MKPRALIVFPSSHLAYSPTTINLYDALSARFEVTILAIQPPPATRLLENRRVEYVRVPYWPLRITSSIQYRLRRYFHLDVPVGGWWRALPLLRAARRHRAAGTTVAIGVDFLCMWIVQRVFGHGHMVSLEIEDHDPFHRRVDWRRIDSLLIQTQARYDHLFAGSGVKRFLVQNAPIYHPPSLPEPALEPPEHLLYCGTAVPGFGINRCLDFLVRYPEFQLTIQGAASPEVRSAMARDYPDLVASGRVTINDTYLEGEELLRYLRRFAIGLCCYDLSVPGMNTFNYLSAPSGKLFTYYAAGVPVIGSDIPGLASVREFDAGVLIAEFTPETIRQAVAAIVPERERLSANCRRAAQHFSFDRTSAPFIEQIAADTPSPAPVLSSV